VQINHKGRKDYADRVVKIKSPNNEEYVKAVENIIKQKSKRRWCL